MSELFLNYKIKCAVCESHFLFRKDDYYYCSNNKCTKNINPYLLFNKKPVIINFEKSVIVENKFHLSHGGSTVLRTDKNYLLKIRNSLRKKNLIVFKNVNFLIKYLHLIQSPKILVVGGGEIGNGMDEIYRLFKNNIVSLDIYDSKYVDIIADAHMIPFDDDYFDLVIIQAVLEHVINPQRVVSEIWRVLFSDGIVYAETPFMQQIHEGPYDFTRFSDSGHRYLFRNFNCIKSGQILGVGTSLVWSINFFFSGVFRSKIIGKIFKLLFFWLTYFDSFVPEEYNIEGASGIYFLGSKSKNKISSQDLIEYFKGVKKK